MNFEHMKRQPRMLARAPTPGLSALPGSWETRDLQTYNKSLPFSGPGSPFVKGGRSIVLSSFCPALGSQEDLARADDKGRLGLPKELTFSSTQIVADSLST